jgi:hypothetical protein
MILARIARWTVLLLLFMCLLEIFAGCAYRGSPAWKEWHLWGGHSLAQATLVVFVITLVALIQLSMLLRSWRPLWRALVPVLAVVLAYHTSFTGYLGPWRNPGLDNETIVRFRVIHQFMEPVLLASLLVGWWFLVRRLDSLPEHLTGSHK